MIPINAYNKAIIAFLIKSFLTKLETTDISVLASSEIAVEQQVFGLKANLIETLDTFEIDESLDDKEELDEDLSLALLTGDDPVNRAIVNEINRIKKEIKKVKVEQEKIKSGLDSYRGVYRFKLSEQLGNLYKKERSLNDDLFELRNKLMDSIKNLNDADEIKKENVRETLFGLEVGSVVTKALLGSIKGAEKRLRKIREDMAKLQAEKLSLKKASVQDIKDGLLKKVVGAVDSLKDKDLLEEEPRELPEFDKLLAAVSSDPAKAVEMQGLISRYKELGMYISSSNSKERILPPFSIPFTLQKRFNQLQNPDDPTRYPEFIYSPLWNQILMPKRFVEVVEDFESDFLCEKEMVEKEFTDEKMLKLVGKESFVDDKEVDLDFLGLHSDKIVPGDLEELKKLVNKRNNAKKNLFKKKLVDSLTKQINNLQTKIYKEIILWYKTQSFVATGDLFDVQKPITLEFKSPMYLSSYLYSLRNVVASLEANINTIKQHAEKFSKDESIASFERERTIIALRMRELAGINIGKEDEINYDPNRVGIDAESNKTIIAEKGAKEKEDKLIETIKDEASNLSKETNKEISILDEESKRKLILEEIKRLREEIDISKGTPNIKTQGI